MTFSSTTQHNISLYRRSRSIRSIDSIRLNIFLFVLGGGVFCAMMANFSHTEQFLWFLQCFGNHFGTMTNNFANKPQFTTFTVNHVLSIVILIIGKNKKLSVKHTNTSIFLFFLFWLSYSSRHHIRFNRFMLFWHWFGKVQCLFVYFSFITFLCTLCQPTKENPKLIDGPL